jgi:SNF2 family DNA or RNA helicase
VLAELPPILIQDLPMELLPEQESSYKEVAYEASRAAAFGGSASFLLARITELKKICNFDPETGASCKLEALTDIADSIDGAGGKLLIFSQYVQTLRKIQKSLPIPATLYYGGLAIPERDEIVRAFKEEPGPRALLISLKAGGVGLNLPNASHVVMFDRWWNPAVEMQAIQRAHRFGRSSRLHVIRFLVINTIEERIVRLLHDKQDMFEDLVEDAPSATTRIGLLKELLVLK